MLKYILGFVPPTSTKPHKHVFLSLMYSDQNILIVWLTETMFEVTVASALHKDVPIELKTNI